PGKGVKSPWFLARGRLLSHDRSPVSALLPRIVQGRRDRQGDQATYLCELPTNTLLALKTREGAHTGRVVLPLIPDSEKVAPLFADSGVVELSFLHSVRIEPHYKGRAVLPPP